MADPCAALPATASDPGPAPASYAQDLSRSLSLRENMLLTLSSVTPASSVFIVMPAVIQGLGGAAAVAFAIAAVAGVLMAFCYAELSSAFPITGGEYAFAARTLGRSTGFALFALSLLGGVLVTAVIALGTGSYLGVVWGALDGKGAGLAVIVLSSLVAVLNIRTNAWVVAIMLYVSYESVEADWRPVAIAVGMLAVGYTYYYAYLHPRRADRWTMPDPVREEDESPVGRG